jgi:hypothetical protein
MFRHELSIFLARVLDAVALLPDGLRVDATFEPEPQQIAMIAFELGADYQEVRDAVMGLQAGYCLVEESLEIPGIEPLHRWKVHPQCRLEASENSS